MPVEYPSSHHAKGPSLARALTLLLVLLIAPFPGAAAQAETAPEPGAGGLAQVRLSEDQVTGFIESYPRLRELGEKYDGVEETAVTDRNPASAFVGMLKNQAAMRELNGVLNDHGFADFNEWAQVAYTIMIAHHWKGDDKGPAAQLDKAIEQIRANKQLGDEQKEMLISRIEAQKGMMALFTPDPQNVALVSQYGEQIEQAIAEGRSGR